VPTDTPHPSPASRRAVSAAHRPGAVATAARSLVRLAARAGAWTSSRVAAVSRARAWRRLRDERGSVLLLTVLALTAMIGMTSLTLDAGRYYELRRELQNAVDAAAHAGAQSLPDTAAAAANAQQYFAANAPDIGASDIVVTYPTPDHETIHIDVDAQVAFLFAPVLGIHGATVHAEADAGARTTDMVVVLDRSGSMCVDTYGLMLNCPTHPPVWQPFNSVQQAAETFAAYFSPTTTQVGLASFSTSATLNRQLSSAFGPGSAYVTAIDALVPAGWTDTGGGLATALAELQSARARANSLKVIVLLSDGVANIEQNGTNCGGSGCAAAANYARSEATAAANAGVVIYTIGLGSDVDASLMQDLATIGHGAYVYSPSGAQLQDTFDRVARLVRVKLLR
jgi:Flp pilus assembly protein TadG